VSTTPGETPFDPGLQPERTLLAWRRTCLAVSVGSLLFLRLAFAELGALAVVLGGLGLLLAAVAYLDSARRYRRLHAGLTAGLDSVETVPSAGVPVTIAAASVAVLGVAAVIWLMVRG
jgi:uncharacterized membrane protein YidH (DUF202 family)